MIKNIKSIIASAILISLTACGSPTSTQSNTPTASPEPTTAAPAPTASPETTAATEGVIFKEPIKGKLNGYIDALNNSAKTPQTVAPDRAIQLSGWAIVPDGSKPADSVIITYGDSNTVATTIPVGLNRPDVAKNFKNPALEKSGWVAVIDPANLNLTGETAKLKAWSYDSQTKEAHPLGNSFEIVRK
jgi:hypothetical protein